MAKKGNNLTAFQGLEGLSLSTGAFKLKFREAVPVVNGTNLYLATSHQEWFTQGRLGGRQACCALTWELYPALKICSLPPCFVNKIEGYPRTQNILQILHKQV
jgi:hypothetical protein